MLLCRRFGVGCQFYYCPGATRFLWNLWLIHLWNDRRLGELMSSPWCPRNRLICPILHSVICCCRWGSISGRRLGYRVYRDGQSRPQQGHLCSTAPIGSYPVLQQKHNGFPLDWSNKSATSHRTMLDDKCTFFEKRSWLEVACQYSKVPSECVAINACLKLVVLGLLDNPVTGEWSPPFSTNCTLP